MAKHPERTQKNAPLDDDGGKALNIQPLTNLGDRINNPDDIEPDEAAMAAGVSHGGNIESHHESRNVRGSGGRKRSGPRGKGEPGRDLSKPR